MHIYLSTYVLCRLIVGWIWEEFIIGLFTLITEELSGSKHVDTIVSIVLTVGMYYMYCVRDTVPYDSC